MREETHATIAQTIYLPRTTSSLIVEQSHHFAFTEMIATAIRTELAHFFEEVGELICAQPIKTKRECALRVIMTQMRRIFATLRLIRWNAECVQDFR